MDQHMGLLPADGPLFALSSIEPGFDVDVNKGDWQDGAYISFPLCDPVNDKVCVFSADDVHKPERNKYKSVTTK